MEGHRKKDMIGRKERREGMNGRTWKEGKAQIFQYQI
jgi:hypothetical protein